MSSTSGTKKQSSRTHRIIGIILTSFLLALLHIARESSFLTTTFVSSSIGSLFVTKQDDVTTGGSTTSTISDAAVQTSTKHTENATNDSTSPTEIVPDITKKNDETDGIVIDNSTVDNNDNSTQIEEESKSAGDATQTLGGKFDDKDEENKEEENKIASEATASINTTQVEECIVLNDKVLPKNVTQPPGTFIPREIHFFVESRCIPKEIADHLHLWESIQDHSVFYHDKESIYEYLQQPRPEMPFIAKAANCAFTHEAILDLARLTWLYEHGGISVDIDHIPGPAFANGTQTVVHYNPYGFEHHFVVEDESSNPYPRFIASEPRHYATYGALLLSIGLQYTQFHYDTVVKHQNSYHDSRNYIYRTTLEDYLGRDYNLSVTRKSKQGQSNNQIIILHSNRTSEDIFVKISSLSEGSIKKMKLTPLSQNIKQCVDLNNDSFEVDVDFLLNVTGTNLLTGDTGECPNNLTYISNTYIPESVNASQRKIPKIVHMTSKSKCFSKPYANNADLWRFEGYSFFLHDDEAVHRLIDSREWPEFPLLKEVLPCLVTGASLADFWRYLALWEYGGIYTDMDNAPGYSFNGGSVIANDDDGFFEVERALFPSQYFFALSPHHPLAYFTVSVTIGRLMLLANTLSKTQMIPFITGPGAVKSAMVSNIGDAYPQQGKYVGVSNRTITMVGSPEEAKRGVYCNRSKVKVTEEYLDIMNMTHYLNHKKRKRDKTFSCRHAIALSNHVL